MSERSALSALFARASRNSERVILPINDNAFEKNDSLRPAFYCVHSLSGAGGMDFHHLAKRLPSLRFYGIQAPPKKMADAEFGGSVQEIADYYASALVKHQPNGPFLLGGWSAGAIIGLEIAQNLRARGRDVALFVAIDAAPEKGQADHSIANGYAVEGFMDLSRYPEDQRSFMKRLYNALLEYTPKTYFGDVLVYEARVRPLFKLPQVGRVWREIAPRARVVRVKGTHLSILREDDVSALAEDLRIRVSRMVPEPSSTDLVSVALNEAA